MSRPENRRAEAPRTRQGTFKSGVSGNPGGRPKAVRELLERARGSVPEAFDLAERLVRDDAADPRVRLEAAKFLTAYGLGPPPKEAPRDPFESMTDDELREAAQKALASRVPAASADDGTPTSH